MLVRAPAASRALLRPLQQSSGSTLVRPKFTAALSKTKSHTQITRFCTAALQSSRPTITASLRATPLGLRSDVFRLQTRTQTNVSKEQQSVLDQKLQSSPNVSATSSINPVFGESKETAKVEEEEKEMLGGVKSDMVSNSTFLLQLNALNLRIGQGGKMTAKLKSKVQNKIYRSKS